jgi:hypothetical protein
MTAGLSHAKMDLSFTVDSNKVVVEYMTELFGTSTIDRLLGSLTFWSSLLTTLEVQLYVAAFLVLTRLWK